jgi:hypothetical protein
VPNWCNNVVTLRHADAAMLIRAQEGFKKGELLQTFIPCPQELRDTQAVHYPEGHADKAAQDALVARNIAEHGFANWYDWQVAHWGTKWDVGSDDDGADIEDDVLTLSFDSAWGPPCDAYDRLEDLGFAIEAYYYEPGMAFCGSWAGGMDNCINIPSTSAEAAKVIPEAIDEMFDIVNSMAMWEEEEEASE